MQPKGKEDSGMCLCHSVPPSLEWYPEDYQKSGASRLDLKSHPGPYGMGL